MSRPKWVTGAAIAVVGAVAMAGSASAKPLSTKEWRTQANVVCDQVNEDIDAAAGEAFAGLGQDDEPSPEQVSAFADELVSIAEDGIAEIDDLEEPKAVKKSFKKYKAALTDALENVTDDPSLLTETKNPFAKADKIGKKLRLTCG